MSNKIMQDKYVLGQSIDKSITSFGQEIRLDVSLLDNPNGFNGGKISGKVTDVNGNFIEKALIKIMSSDYEPLMHTLTNASGQYSFINIEANNTYNIFAIAPGKRLKQGNQFTITNFEERKIDFILENDPAMSLGIIAGDLIDGTSNTPINGAIVTLFQNQENANDILQAVVYTNQYGQFVFREIPIGNYTIKVNALGYKYTNKMVSIDNGGKIASVKINLTIEDDIPNGTVSGIITNNNNQPVERADVILYSIDSNKNLTPIAFTKTNINGVYLFDNVPVGNYKVKANEIELVMDNGNVWEYSPYFDSFVLSKPLSFNPKVIDITKGDLLNDSSLKIDGEFVGDLGGNNNGSVRINVNVEKNGLYNLEVKYLSGDKEAPIKVDVNNVISNNIFIAEKTIDWNKSNAEFLNIQVMLTEGVNTIKFYNDTGESSPYISTANLILKNPYTNIDATMGTLSSGAIEKIEGEFVGNIGDDNSGYVSLNVSVSTFGKYNLDIEYLSGDNITTLKMDVNGSPIGTSYSFDKTNSWNKTDALLFNTSVNLMPANNIIRLYNDKNTKSPWIGKLTFNPEIINLDYNLAQGNLTNGATLSFNNLMVSNIGGTQNGAVDLNINIPVKGNYILEIQYLTSNVLGSPLKINVNSNLIGSYMAPYTGENQIENSKMLKIKVSLDKGNNTFKFYNNTGVLSPSIGKINLILIDDLYLTSNAVDGVISGNASLAWNNNFVNGIGGSENSALEITLKAPIMSDYIMKFRYLTQDENSKNLKININGNLIGSHELPTTNYSAIEDAKIYKTLVNLNEGNNIIRFYNDTGAYAPDIGSIIFTRLTSFRSFTRAEMCVLSGSASVKNGLVKGISSSGGELILVVDVPQNGEYDLTINYTAGDDNSKSNVDVNNINTGEIYKFDSTDSWNASKVSSKTIKVTLTKGVNNIRFYNVL